MYIYSLLFILNCVTFINSYEQKNHVSDSSSHSHINIPQWDFFDNYEDYNVKNINDEDEGKI